MSLNRHHFWLRDLVNGVMARFASVVHDKNLQLTYEVRPDIPEVLYGDSECLRQVLMNLVANAVKFTTFGDIDVLVETSGADAQYLQFSVRDTGIGVPVEHQGKIFEPFSQVDGSLRRTHGGTGLGLAISAQLVELMNGRMWVESDGKTGSTFRFVVEMQPLLERNPPVSTPQSPESEPEREAVPPRDSLT
jgi:signal transduction histidine kinase